MDPKQIINLISTFFPNNNIVNHVKQGQEMIKGVEDSFIGVQSFIQSRGITNEQIDKVATTILTHPASKKICGMMRTNPQVVANDIRKLKSNSNNTDPSLAPKMVTPKVNGVKQFRKI